MSAANRSNEARSWPQPRCWQNSPSLFCDRRNQRPRTVLRLPDSSRLSALQLQRSAQLSGNHAQQVRSLSRLTGLDLKANCGLDTRHALGDWHGISLMTEIVVADFTEVQRKRAEEAMPAQSALFAAA